MRLPGQKIEIIARRHDIMEYYKNLGYDAEINKKFIVDAEDLQPGSGKMIDVECDYCKKQYKMPNNIYHKNVLNGTIKKCACLDCCGEKRKEVMLLKYGVDNSMKLKEVQEKARKTTLERYGVENILMLQENKDKAIAACIEKYGSKTPFENKEFQDKIKQIRLEKYGVEYIFQSDEFKEKAELTCIEKYGGISPMVSDEIRKKGQKTCKEKYGYIHPLSADSVLSKASKTRFINGTCVVSKEQKRISELLNGENNYPVGRFNVDMLIGDSIVLEYDGGAHAIDIKYGRMTKEEFDEREKNRTRYIIDHGYKVIRFNNSFDLYIRDEQYINAFESCKAMLGTNDYVEFDFATNKANVM